MKRADRRRSSLLASLIVGVVLSFRWTSAGLGQELQVPVDSAAYRAALSELPIPVEPRLHLSPKVPPSVGLQLESAFVGAVDRLRTSEACRQLFSDLELEAERALDFAIFYAASPLEEATICRHNVAFARHGRGPIRLCRRFAALSSEQAAEVVLHEALHRAGLPECHTDPEAEDPAEIHLRVVQACGRPDSGTTPYSLVGPGEMIAEVATLEAPERE